MTVYTEHDQMGDVTKIWPPVFAFKSLSSLLGPGMSRGSRHVSPFGFDRGSDTNILSTDRPGAWSVARPCTLCQGGGQGRASRAAGMKRLCPASLPRV